MTALAGAIWSPDDAPLAESTARSMHAAMRGRGGAEVSVMRSDVAFGQAHLPTPGSLVSVSGRAMIGENREQTIRAVLDGRIDNFDAVRQRLQAAGFELHTSNPADVVSALYEEEGVAAFARLQGAYAIAVWDSERRELTLARDPSGRRPLYYRRSAHRLIFASEPRALRQAISGTPALNPSALDEYLTYGYVPPPHTLLQGVSKVPPGCWVRLRDGRLDSDRFDPTDLRYALSAKRIDAPVPGELFADRSGRANRPLVTLLQEALAAAVPGGSPLVVFAADAASSPGRILCELAADQMQADSVALPHAAETPPLDWLNWFSQCVEPVAHPNAAAVYVAAQAAASAGATLLTTSGGEELFALQPRHKLLRAFRHWAPGWLTKLVGADLGSADEQSQAARTRQKKYLDAVCVFREQDRAGALAAEYLATLPDADPEDFLHLAFDRTSGRDPISQAALADWQTLVPNAQVAPADWAGSALGCEIRHPFLEDDAVRLLAATPGNLRNDLAKGLVQRGDNGKSLLVGPAGGFTFEDVPLASLDAILNDQRFLKREFLDEGYGEHLVAYTASNRPQPNLHRQAFAFAALEVWLRDVLDGE